MSYNENVITKTHKLISRFASMYIKCMATDVLVCVLDKCCHVKSKSFIIDEL